AAQALGSRSASGRAAGTQGRCAAVSFFPAQPLGGWGDGGAVLPGDRTLADQARSLRQHGRAPGDPSAAGERYLVTGGNWRLGTLPAAGVGAEVPPPPGVTGGRPPLP